MRIRLPFFFSLALLVLGIGCKRRTGLEAEGGLPPKRSADRLLADIERSLYTPQRAELKGDVYVDSPDFGNLKLSGTFRTKADDAFWLSLRKFGFEGARALVTRDSVIALNRLQREVLVASASDLPDWALKLPIQPSLANLQAAFGGQPIGEWSGADVERMPGAYLMQLPASRQTRLTVAAGDRKLPQRWQYQDDERYGEVVFGDFREVEQGKVYPYRRSLVFSDSPGDTTRVRIQLESISPQDDIRFPINVPRNYKPMSL